MSQKEFLDALDELDFDADLPSSPSFEETLVTDLDLLWDDALSHQSVQTGEKRVNTDEPSATVKVSRLNDEHHSCSPTDEMPQPVECLTSERKTGYYRPKGHAKSSPLRKSRKGKGAGKRTVTSRVHGEEETPPALLSLSSEGSHTEERRLNTTAEQHSCNNPIECIPTQDRGHLSQPEGSDAGNTNLPASPCSPIKGFTITEKSRVFRKKYNVSEVIHEVKLSSDMNNTTWLTQLDLLFEAIHTVLQRSTEGLHADDLVRVYIHQKGLDTPLVLSLRPLSEISVQALFELIEKMLQSNQSLVFDESFELHVGTIRLIKGGKGTSIINIDDAKLRKRCIIRITNKDHMCAVRAVVVAKARAENDPNYLKIAFHNKTLQTQLAEKLCREAGVDARQPVTLEQIKLLENAVGMQIVVVSADACNEIVYKGSIVTDTKLYLLYHNEHYDVITKMNTFYGSSYYCDVCFKTYDISSKHRCTVKCPMCYAKKCTVDAPVDCSKCNRRFRNQNCFDRHMKRRKSAVPSKTPCRSICERFWLCKHCKKLMERKKRSPEQHRCGERFCSPCRVFHMGDHKCYMQPEDKSITSSLYIFLDYETNQESGEHVPNYCVAQKVCSACIDIEDITQPCETCGVREVMFEGDNTTYDVGRWLFREEHRGYTVVAHNAKSFDSYFLLKYLTSQTITPDMIYSGGKIMTMTIRVLKMRVIDSLNLIPTRLANLPKTFNVQAKKGDFAHLFNTRENQSYIGPLPDIKYYGVDSMSEKDRREFLEWHKEQREKGYVFDFRKEIAEYCSSDVTILRLCCLKFRKLILQITTPEKTAVDDTEPCGLDPLQSVTIASLCFAIFQTMFLKRWQVALVPATGIVERDQFSQGSIRWLEWLMYKERQQGRDLYIQHALNEGEHKIGKIKLDGFHFETNTAYEYLGCLYHACLKCNDKDTIHPLHGTSMQNVHDSTMEGIRRRERLGFKCVYIWEHEFTEQIRTDPELKRFVENLDIVPRLDPKDAFYGGRTSTFKMYHEAKDDTQIKYLDFTSLYPYVNKYSEYPIGYPEIITRDFGDVHRYKGFIKCKVIPPRKVYTPVLPYRSHGRLMFPLCGKCCDDLTPVCSHTDEERALVGTWVSFELLESLKEGYRLVKIYEVYHFPQTSKYDGVNDDTGIFTKYINTFLRIKQESSGWPDWIENEADKEAYIRSYADHEGIHLDPCKIEKNHGLRAVAKLSLNSLWGKFAQRNGLNQNTFVSTPEEFYRKLTDKTIQVTDFHDVNENMVLLDWHKKTEHVTAGMSSNIYIAAFTTCHARLLLFSVLKQLGRRLIYADTDSVIFYTDPSQDDPPTGDFLGQLTSELAPGDYIKVIASGGPKNYAYKTKFEETVTKVRGFTLNFKNSKVINFETVRDMVCNTFRKCPCKETNEECTLCVRTVYNARKITRDKRNIAIVNKEEKKDYRIRYIKRVVQDDYDTLPYGY